MPNITRPDVEIISVDQFKELINRAREEKIKEGLSMSVKPMVAPNLNRGTSVPTFNPSVDANIKILHPEEASVVSAVDNNGREYVNKCTSDKGDGNE